LRRVGQQTRRHPLGPESINARRYLRSDSQRSASLRSRSRRATKTRPGSDIAGERPRRPRSPVIRYLRGRSTRPSRGQQTFAPDTRHDHQRDRLRCPPRSATTSALRVPNHEITGQRGREAASRPSPMAGLEQTAITAAWTTLSYRRVAANGPVLGVGCPQGNELEDSASAARGRQGGEVGVAGSGAGCAITPDRAESVGCSGGRKMVDRGVAGRAAAAAAVWFGGC